MDGLLIIDKPAGPTSHDIVQRVRKILRLRRVGHGGTLDPGATGVLLVAVGQGTRFFPFLSEHDKSYEGTIRLGFATDTYDASGRATTPESRDMPPLKDVARAMKGLHGEITQAPPPYSAKKVAGTPGYRLARAGKEFTLKPATVRIMTFEPVAYAPPRLDFRAVCSSGTYVRSLAHDLGRTLGCGAHLRSLRRTSVGPYTVAMAVPLARIEEAAAAGRSSEVVLPLEKLLPEVPTACVRPEALPRLKNGAPLFPEHLAAGGPAEEARRPPRTLFRMVDANGRLLALARLGPDGERLHPLLVIV